MTPYRSKVYLLPGTNLAEVTKQAHRILHDLERRTRRKPYVRSAYFGKRKIFFDYFWNHVQQKIAPERYRRFKLLPSAIDLIRYSRNQPTSLPNPHKRTERLHRFLGVTREGHLFAVQIKENLRSGRLYFMSCFPWKE